MRSALAAQQPVVGHVMLALRTLLVTAHGVLQAKWWVVWGVTMRGHAALKSSRFVLALHEVPSTAVLITPNCRRSNTRSNVTQV
jgi:hypothetical protein